MAVERLKLKIDLKAMLGDIEITDDIKQAAADDAIAMIVERTQSGKAVNGRNFKKLSDSYARYKHGLVGNSNANLTLFGDMLGSIEVIEETKNSITLGWNDEGQNAKAFNHHTGDTLPPRPFFDLQKKELKELKSKLQEISGSETLSPAQQERETALKRALRLLSKI